jgi:hypothetical protein
LKKWVVILGLLLAACSSHDDILPPIDVAEPPTPTNFQVETTDLLTYHLSWEIGDPAVVKEYRIYSQYSTSGPVLEGTTVSTSIDVVSPVAIEGLVFCVSAVTVENVESHLTCGSSD